MKITRVLHLDACPRCGASNAQFSFPVAAPHGHILPWVATSGTDHNRRCVWAIYQCIGCGGCILAKSDDFGEHAINDCNHKLQKGELSIAEIVPAPLRVDQDLPDRAKTYLAQALSSLHAPDGAVMLAASAVDAMLKEAGFKKGTLYARVEQAQKTGRITTEMAAWAHQVRLDANEPRHADEDAPHHDTASAQRAVDFARALGEYLFVLPKRVTRGIEASQGTSAPTE